MKWNRPLSYFWKCDGLCPWLCLLLKKPFSNGKYAFEPFGEIISLLVILQQYFYLEASVKVIISSWKVFSCLFIRLLFPSHRNFLNAVFFSDIRDLIFSLNHGGSRSSHIIGSYGIRLLSILPKFLLENAFC